MYIIKITYPPRYSKSYQFISKTKKLVGDPNNHIPTWKLSKSDYKCNVIEETLA